jgi:selenocysteine lyase/cysteine desulfurase
MKLNIEAVRKEFPSLQNEWILMDNAGGSQILQKVINRINDYLLNSNVQLGASYKLSELAGKMLIKLIELWASSLMHAQNLK